MKTYAVVLEGGQYSRLEKMLSANNARQLAMNQPIYGYLLFGDVIEAIYTPVEDGWSTLEIVLLESVDQLQLLRFLTKQIFPQDEDYFVRQIGKEFYCPKDYMVQIHLTFK